MKNLYVRFFHVILTILQPYLNNDSSKRIFLGQVALLHQGSQNQR
jgi:hypothetical protein